MREVGLVAEGEYETAIEETIDLPTYDFSCATILG